MLAFATAPTAIHPAVVARTDLASHAETYLVVTPAGRTVWVRDPEAATPFASMREATRMALRLPAAQRAYSLPREAELATRGAH